jgi:hypothetical protein
MDIKCKICDILTRKKNIHFSTYPPPTMIHLSHRFTKKSKPADGSLLTVVSATSAPPFQNLSHQRNVCNVSRPNCELIYATNTSHRKQETFLYDCPLHWVLCPQNRTTERCSSVMNSSSTVAILTTETSL